MKKVIARAVGLILLFLMISSGSSLEAGRFRRRPRHPGNPPTPVAEPASIALLGVGLASLALLKKKKNNDK